MWRFLKWTGLLLLGVMALVGGMLFRANEEMRIKPRQGCPILAKLLPLDHSEILPTDYIQLHEVSAGPYPWNPVHIRIFGDGRVERETVETVRGDTFGCPLHESDRVIHVAPAIAQAILRRARDGGFCRLCSLYRSPGFVFDAGSSEITVVLRGKTKSVTDAAGDPPALFRELTESIWKVSPMQELADPMRLSAEREAECKAFEEKNWKQYSVANHAAIAR